MVIIVPDSVSQAASTLLEFSGQTVLLLGGVLLSRTLLEVLVRKVSGQQPTAACSVLATVMFCLLGGVLCSSSCLFLAGAAYGLGARAIRSGNPARTGTPVEQVAPTEPA